MINVNKYLVLKSLVSLKSHILKPNIYFFNKAANWAAAPLALIGAVIFGP